MRTLSLIVLAILAALAFTTGHSSSSTSAAPTRAITVTTVASHCEEDQPCWDSRTMGNHQAGVGAPHGPRHGTCERGGVLKRNAAHRLVCDYSGTHRARPRVNAYGGSGGAVCGSDAQCRAYDRAHTSDDAPGSYLVRDARGRLVGVCTPARGCGTVTVNR